MDSELEWPGQPDPNYLPEWLGYESKDVRVACDVARKKQATSGEPRMS